MKKRSVAKRILLVVFAAIPALFIIWFILVITFQPVIPDYRTDYYYEQPHQDIEKILELKAANPGNVALYVAPDFNSAHSSEQFIVRITGTDTFELLIEEFSIRLFNDSGRQLQPSGETVILHNGFSKPLHQQTVYFWNDVREHAPVALATSYSTEGHGDFTIDLDMVYSVNKQCHRLRKRLKVTETSTLHWESFRVH